MHSSTIKNIFFNAVVGLGLGVGGYYLAYFVFKAYFVLFHALVGHVSL